MFIGHYGAAFAFKKAEKKIPLWLYFTAATLPDIILYILMLMRIEILEKSPGFTKWVGLKSIYFPYSHGLISNLIIAVIIFAAVLLFCTIRKYNRSDAFKISLVLAAAFLSHFLFEIPVHAPDLAIDFNGTLKFGLGLWDYPVLSNLLELLIFFWGLSLYLRSVSLVMPKGKYLFFTMAGFIIAVHFMLGIIPPMDNMNILAINLLAISFMLIAIAWYFEKKCLK